MKYFITDNSIKERETNKTIYTTKNSTLLKIMCDRLNAEKLKVSEIITDCFIVPTRVSSMY